MPIDGFGFGGGWFHGFAAAGCVASGFAMAGLVTVGFEALGLTALSLVVVRFKQHQVQCTDAAETTSVTKTPEHNGNRESCRFVHAVSGRQDNQPNLRINVL